MNGTLLAILVYVLAQLGIGWWVARRIRTEDDYLVAGRNMGYGLAIFTIFATWFGAETCVSAAGAIYESGLSGGSADPFGYAVCLFLMGLVFAVPLWKRRLTTMGDLFRQRFSPAVERLAVLLMVPTSLFWAAAQIRAFGQVISSSSGLQVELTIIVAALVVVVYTVSGGFLADAMTDLVQGIALILGLGVLLVVVLLNGGAEAVTRVEPGRLQILGGGSVPWYEVAEAWAIPVLGSVVAAELVARVVATRTPTIARNSFFAGGAAYLAIGLIPVTLGLIGTQVLPGLDDPEQIVPRLAQIHLPGMLYVLFAGALVSAILSTVDSTLLTASSLVSHNILVPLRPGLSEAAKVRSARIGVAVFGVLACLMALSAEAVYTLVEQSSAFGSAGIVVTVTFGLFTRLGGPLSALAALLAGVLVWVVGNYVLGLSWAYLAAVGASITAYAAGALIERAHALRRAR
jgi:Na+/proline symporter